MAASVARKGLPHFTGASFNGRTAFLYSAYIRSIRIAPTIGSVQAALPELFSPFWQIGKTLDGPDRRAHGAHSLGAGPQEPRAGRCNSVRPTRRKRDKPCGNRPARIAAARNARKPVHTTKKHATAGRDRWQPGIRRALCMVAGSLPADVSGAVSLTKNDNGRGNAADGGPSAVPLLHTLNGRSITRQTHMGQ